MKFAQGGLPIFLRWLRREEPANLGDATRASGLRQLPRPALRWVGVAGRVALRPFDWIADADAVCRWQQETYCINFPGFVYTDSFEAAFRQDLRRASLDGDQGLFVLDDGAPCGFAWAIICCNTWTGERYGYLNNLYVLPDRRGQGLAEELITLSEDWFKKRRIKRVRLTVTVSNEVACGLYKKLGYGVARWEMDKELTE